MSKNISLNQEQFERLMEYLPVLDLSRVPDDPSEFPLDFRILYKNKHELNFEYLHDNLEFFVIDGSDPDEIIEKEIFQNIQTWVDKSM